MGMLRVINQVKILRYILSLCLLVFTGCAIPIKGLYPPISKQESKVVYVVSHGWHTGIIVHTDDIPKDTIPEKSHFNKATFLEIGWGDKGFYQSPKITLRLTLQALFLPSDSVMHVVGFSQKPEKEFPYSEIIQLQLSDVGFQEMIKEIHTTFDRQNHSIAQGLRKGLYGDSKFYTAKGKYSALHTCNNWTASMLRASGFPITVQYSASASNIIDQIHMRGRIIRIHKRDPILYKPVFTP